MKLNDKQKRALDRMEPYVSYTEHEKMVIKSGDFITYLKNSNTLDIINKKKEENKRISKRNKKITNKLKPKDIKAIIEHMQNQIDKQVESFKNDENLIQLGNNEASL